MESDRQDKLVSKAGITLIEAIVSIVILGICIGGATQLALTARQISDQARDHYIAINLAKNRLERARTFEFIQMQLFAENNVVVNESGVPHASGRFRRSTIVSNVNAQLASVTVTVDVRDRVQLAFMGEKESVQSYLADFSEVVE